MQPYQEPPPEQSYHPPYQEPPPPYQHPYQQPEQGYQQPFQEAQQSQPGIQQSYQEPPPYSPTQQVYQGQPAYQAAQQTYQPSYQQPQQACGQPYQPFYPPGAGYPAQAGQKDWLVTLLLCLFLGVFGIHRFYTGHIAIGVIQLLTFGLCGIWTLVDLILIVTDNYKDANGLPLRKP